MPHFYALAFGANIYRRGPPARTIGRAFEAIEAEGLTMAARSRAISTRPIGPGRRDFANAAGIVETVLAPPALLTLLKRIERRFGRRRSRRWGDRVLDIDILLWSGGLWADSSLVIPHRGFRDRVFVLDPLAEIAPGWRDPITGLTVRQLRHRLKANSPVDRTHPRP